jgi:hypothetical protein
MADCSSLAAKFPPSNRFVTMLNQMGVPCEQFADSTGDIGELPG